MVAQNRAVDLNHILDLFFEQLCQEKSLCADIFLNVFQENQVPCLRCR